MSNTFPKLLVSARNAYEAFDAVTGGADWIDMKEPFFGPLGAVSADAAREIAAKLRGRAPISAALGELVDWRDSSARELLEVPEINVVKTGLAQCAGIDWQNQWVELFAKIQAAGKHLAAVIYADWQEIAAPAPEDVLECAKQAGGEYLLIDTWNKSGSSTLQIMSVKKLCNILLDARNSGIKTVLAGKISHGDLSIVCSLPVDIVAVRSAVCRAGRESRLDSQLVNRFRNLLCSRAVISNRMRAS
jgi:(5-formylfuran-3-yl)methyl phosphate synthase